MNTVSDPVSDDDEFNRFANSLSLRIRDLPNNPQTVNALQEIEELLDRSDAGGTKLSNIEKAISSIPDPDLQAKKLASLRKLLARFIFSIDMTKAERDQLFRLWQNGELIDIKKLLSKQPVTINDIVNGYDTNQGIREITNELLRQTGYGRGKGEYFLTTFSKRITRRSKGDILIDNNINIEVKAADQGGSRFYDRDISPGQGYSSKVAKFYSSFASEISFVDNPKSGLSFNHLITIVDRARETGRYNKIMTALHNIFKDVYGDKTSGILDGIDEGDAIKCTQLSAEATFDKYMEVKGTEEGVLFLELASQPPFFVFFKNSKDLKNAGMSLSAKHGYPITTYLPYAYPQISVVSTQPTIDPGPTPVIQNPQSGNVPPRQGREIPPAQQPNQPVQSNQSIRQDRTIPQPQETEYAPTGNIEEPVDQLSEMLDTYRRLSRKY